MKNQWFVIHTLSGQEQKVKESIEKRLKAEEMGEFIKEVLVPMEKVAEVRSGKKTVSTRKLHPGYVYIDMSLLDENRRILEKPWYFIRDTPGIIGFVGGDRPIPVTPEEIAVIFDRYQQVEKRGRKALGLGLYISRSIVESHGGRIGAESVPGEGSTFLFTLRRA